MALNILGTELEICGSDPKTGYYRDGFCDTDASDRGSHVICAIVTQEFLDYTRTQGNDLTTPAPNHNFPGLKPGDQWCLCASRWLEAWHAGAAPSVRLTATHAKALEFIARDILIKAAARPESPCD